MKRPVQGQTVIAADGDKYVCVFEGDEPKDGVPVKSELWESIPPDVDYQYFRSLPDYLNGVFDGAMFHALNR